MPVRPGWRSSYTKVTTRAAHDWPALGLSLLGTTSPIGRSRMSRLVLSAAVDRPMRLDRGRGELRGAEISEAALRRAGEAAVAEVEIDSDTRGSVDYKQHLSRVYFGALLQAIAAE